MRTRAIPIDDGRVGAVVYSSGSERGATLVTIVASAGNYSTNESGQSVFVDQRSIVVFPIRLVRSPSVQSILERVYGHRAKFDLFLIYGDE